MEELQQQLAALQHQNNLLQQQVQPNGVQQGQVHRISVKLPPFWKEKPTLWFAQAEAQFILAGITQENTKYAYIVSNLEERVAHEVEDLITNQPAEEPYTTLKRELIKRLSVSEEQRIKQILLEEELGDRKPSQFLRHLQSLASSGPVCNDLLRTIWRQRLPAYVQAILQTQPDTVTLDNLAATADKIMEVHLTAIPSVNATSSSGSVDQLTLRLDQVCQQLIAVQEEIKSLRADSESQHNKQGRFSRSRDRRRSSSRGKLNDNNLCWYHKKFAENANKCISPCNYQSTNSKGSQ